MKDLTSDREEKMTDEKLCLSVDEAAKLLGVSHPTIYRLIRRPDFPVFKIGRRTLISRSGLERWIEKHANNELNL